MAQIAKRNIDRLLKWIMSKVNLYPDVNVTNFTTSWEDGIALCLLVNSLLGNEILDRAKISKTNKKENFIMAINAATHAGVPALLDVDDLVERPIDRNSMITYLHSVYKILYVERQRAKGLSNDAFWRLSTGSFDAMEVTETRFPTSSPKFRRKVQRNSRVSESADEISNDVGMSTCDSVFEDEATIAEMTSSSK